MLKLSTLVQDIFFSIPIPLPCFWLTLVLLVREVGKFVQFALCLVFVFRSFISDNICFYFYEPNLTVELAPEQILMMNLRKFLFSDDLDLNSKD